MASPAVVAEPVLVTADNFVRAETDLNFGFSVRFGAFGCLVHNREPVAIDKQTVVRQNRDTLYSTGVFDLDAGPVTLTIPDPGVRFLSMQVIDEDHYVHTVAYGAGTHHLTRDTMATRYMLVAIRILVDPSSAADVALVHALQDAIRVTQQAPGRFEVPNWDEASRRKVRDALTLLGATVGDTRAMFGSRDRVDPVRHLIGTAIGWGGNPERDAFYLTVTPDRNDGSTVYRLVVRDVPVEGFWSVSVYNARGFFEPNNADAHSLNSVTAKKQADGAVPIQFGGPAGAAANWLPIVRGWNYTVRLYRPRATILSGAWTFPIAEPVN